MSIALVRVQVPLWVPQLKPLLFLSEGFFIWYYARMSLPAVLYFTIYLINDFHDSQSFGMCRFFYNGMII